MNNLLVDKSSGSLKVICHHKGYRYDREAGAITMTLRGTRVCLETLDVRLELENR